MEKTKYATADLSLAANMVNAWMNSAGHRANIMDDKVILMTVSIAKIGEETVAVQHFFN